MRDIVVRYLIASVSALALHQSVRAASMPTILLLLISNVFMTFAWYGHLKYKSSPLWIAILVSWGIAFFEYCFQVPANRIGHLDPGAPALSNESWSAWGTGAFNAAQLKTIQEVITLVVFCGFSVIYLEEKLRWNYYVGFGFLVLAAYFIFKKW
jgi:uncharacterized protein (DUF486 family)